MLSSSTAICIKAHPYLFLLSINDEHNFLRKIALLQKSESNTKITTIIADSFINFLIAIHHPLAWGNCKKKLPQIQGKL